MPAARRTPWHAASALLTAVAIVLTACSTPSIEPSEAAPTPSASPVASQTPVPPPEPTRSPLPTPTYTNLPDPELAALIPDAIGGVPVVKPDSIALTPGDVGEVYGRVGARFRSLVIGFTEQPRLSVFAMRVDGPWASTRRLRPYLAEVGRYLGIAELDPAAWSLVTLGDREVWTRGSDEATLPGTTLYTWASRDLVFLMIGTDEAHNAAMLAALPG